MKVHPTKHTERVRLCIDMLNHHFKKGEIKKALAVAYGIRHTQSERYISAARLAIVEQDNKSREEWRGQSLGVYMKIVKDQGTETVMRIKAQERIDKILGLEEPQKVNQFVTGKQALTVKIEYSGDDWQRIPSFDVQAEQNASGN